MTQIQNSIDNKESHPQAYQVVLESFYMDDGLTGNESVDKETKLRKELQELFSLVAFTLSWMESYQTARAS